MFDKYPALVVQPTGAADIGSAVTFARENGLLLAVKCGGHSASGASSCDGGMQIDLSHLRGVRVDPSARTARVEGGSLLGELDHESMAYGLVTTAGVVSHSDHDHFAPGDRVIVTGYDLGMNTPGGFGQTIRIPAAWAVPCPKGLSLKEAMALGTAGFTAAISIHKLIRSGVTPDQGEVLVTGERRPVAGGTIERPYVFEGNDLPGVMTSGAVRRLIGMYSVRPGTQATE